MSNLSICLSVCLFFGFFLNVTPWISRVRQYNPSTICYLAISQKVWLPSAAHASVSTMSFFVALSHFLFVSAQHHSFHPVALSIDHSRFCHVQCHYESQPSWECPSRVVTTKRQHRCVCTAAFTAPSRYNRACSVRGNVPLPAQDSPLPAKRFLSMTRPLPTAKQIIWRTQKIQIRSSILPYILLHLAIASASSCLLHGRWSECLRLCHHLLIVKLSIVEWKRVMRKYSIPWKT